MLDAATVLLGALLGALVLGVVTAVTLDRDLQKRERLLRDGRLYRQQPRYVLPVTGFMTAATAGARTKRAERDRPGRDRPQGGSARW